MKINFRTIHTYSTYNTQTYKRKLNNSEKLEIIGNREETYQRAISNQTSVVRGKPENSTLTPTKGREKSKDEKKIILFLYKTKETSITKRNINLTNKQINQTIEN